VYKLLLLPQAQKDLDTFPQKIFKQIASKIALLSQDPRPVGCLKLTAENGYRIRSWNYRIIYRIDDSEKCVLIYRVKHRKDAY